MRFWFARRLSIAVVPLLLAILPGISACDSLRSLTGLPGEAERQRSTPLFRPAPGVGQQQAWPPPTEPQPPPTEAPPPLPTEEAPREENVKVALLLPLSGKLASLGNAMSDAAQMAMFDVADRRFELMPIDDKGMASGSADAATQAVGQGAQLILGPLLSPSVRSVAPVATNAGVPVLAFSSDRRVTSRGVYIIGFMPEAEVERVVGYAAGRGLRRFAAVAPDNLYGQAVLDALRKSAGAYGATVVRVERYDPSTQDFGPLARRLAGGREATPTRGEATLPPIAGFDALLLAEGGTQLRDLAAALSAVGIRMPGVQLLGTGKWDEPGIGGQDALVGAWFAAPAPVNREEFNDRFRGTFGQAPPRLATLAYDGTALAAVLARGPEARPFSEAALTDPNGFFGRDGLFRLAPDGVVDRKLAIVQVERNDLRVVDEPPRSFAAGS
jgi:ABC-type branched-subunit amino acid transport system substrate-binding protein